ncbi:permease [Escherichia coli]|nr:permease [Escherichia coli]QML58145.1 permease [Escherichia coli]WFW64481.1 permease [Escherichia coli]
MFEWLPGLRDAAGMFLFLAVELSLLFLLISAGVSVIRQKIPDHKIQKMMGARKGRGYLLAAMLGAVTPFCSCSTIPMLRGLLSAKAGFGPTLTFLFVSPLLNPIIVGLMWATFGWKVTLLYAVIACGVSLAASLLLDFVGFEQYVIPAKGSNASCCKPVSDKPVINLRSAKFTPQTTSCCTAEPAVNCCSAAKTAPPSLLTQAIKDAWLQFKEVLPYLLIGVLIGSFIYGFIPAQWIAAHAGTDNPLAIPLSAVIGIPLYIRAEAVIPLASVLMTKGMGMGAVMALIIGSAGASLTEVILLKSMFRTPMIIAFLMVILGMAVVMGYVTQALF